MKLESLINELLCLELVARMPKDTPVSVRTMGQSPTPTPTGRLDVVEVEVSADFQRVCLVVREG